MVRVPMASGLTVVPMAAAAAVKRWSGQLD